MPAATDTISVVIPVYNGVRYLADALHSVLAQTYAAHEIVVVDDGSQDDSAAVVRQFAAAAIPIHYVYQENQGPAAARNRGVDLAAGNLIAFLDQDDLWLPEKLQRQMEHLHRHPGAGYSITQIEIFLDPGVGKPAWVRPERLAAPHPALTPSCLLVWRATFMAVGMFDARLLAGYDTDWFARANDAGIELVVVPETLVRYRVHDHNQSSTVNDNQQYLLQAVRNSLLRKRRASRQ